MGQAPADNELVALFRKGDVDAFTELVRRHHRSLINFFYHCCWDTQESEDLAQEVFLRLANYLKTYIPQAKFTTLLYKIARNLWIDKVRAGAANRKSVSMDVPMSREGEGSLKDTLASQGPGPTEIASRREVASILLRAISVLPEEQRMVLVLCELHGLKYQEASEVLDVPVGTIKSRIHHAVERLRQIMSREPLGEE